MYRMLTFIGMSIGGIIGWKIGDYVGFGTMGAFFISCFGSLIGIIVTWRVTTEYLGI